MENLKETLQHTKGYFGILVVVIFIAWAAQQGGSNDQPEVTSHVGTSP